MPIDKDSAMPKRTIEVQIYVRCRDESCNPVGKVGSIRILFDDIEGCWGAKDRQMVADMIAGQARAIVLERAPEPGGTD